MATIDDYKDRMTSPFKLTRIDPKTRKPIEEKKSVKKSVKKAPKKK